MEDDFQLQPFCLLHTCPQTCVHKHAHHTHAHIEEHVSQCCWRSLKSTGASSSVLPLTASYSRWRLSVRNLYWCVLCRLIPQSSAAVAQPVLTNSRCFLLCAKSKANMGQRKINTMLPHPQLVQPRQLKFPAPFLTTCTLRGSR